MSPPSPAIAVVDATDVLKKAAGSEPEAGASEWEGITAAEIFSSCSPFSAAAALLETVVAGLAMVVAVPAVVVVSVLVSGVVAALVVSGGMVALAAGAPVAAAGMRRKS